MTMLSGKVAIVADGEVRALRDLGPDPVEVKAGVLPLVEVRPDLQDGEVYGAAAYAIEAERVVATYAAVPAPTERRLVDKSLIVERLAEAGLLDAARAALDEAPLLTRERWNARSAIYADDSAALALFADIGADAATILA